jgi:hypothetical protein
VTALHKYQEVSHVYVVEVGSVSFCVGIFIFNINERIYIKYIFWAYIKYCQANLILVCIGPT